MPISNQENPMELPVICLMGPTAVGKTAAALHLAQYLPCEIISVDSVMVYRGMDIGTAKPSLYEQNQVPHHLLSIRDPASPYSAAEFARSVPILIEAIHARQRLPILVGGTGLYFQAWEQGLAPLPSADWILRESLAKEAKALGWPALHHRLAIWDPVAADKIHPMDAQRIQRALEIYMLTGKKFSDHWAHQRNFSWPYLIHRIVILPISRENLRRRIHERFHQMLALGFLHEVEQLWQRNDLSVDLPAMRAVGYRQAWRYLSGIDNYNQMVMQAITATQHYAKRQLTWLRKIQNKLTWTDENREEETFTWIKNNQIKLSFLLKGTKN